MKKGQQVLQASRTKLNATFKERESFIDCVLVGLLARVNTYVVGVPGAAKTQIAEAVTRIISGNFFYIQMNKTTVQEELFGPVTIQSLDAGVYERNLDGTLAEAHIAVIDEFEKGSSTAQNHMLTIAADRRYKNGTQLVNCPIQTMIAASNGLPDGKEAAAMWDRFTLRCKVDYIRRDDNMKDLLLNPFTLDDLNLPTLTLEELAAAQAEAQSLPISGDVIDKVLQLRHAVNDAGIMVSDRKWMLAVKVLKAYAYLNGNSEVTQDDIDVLQHVIWDEPKNIKEAKKLAAKFSNPMSEKILEILDAIQGVHDDMVKGQIEGKDALKKSKPAWDALNKLGSPESNPKLKQAIEKASKLHMAIVQSGMGMTEQQIKAMFGTRS